MIFLPCLIVIASIALLAQLSCSNSIAHAAGQIDRLYVGVHTKDFPNGEIRGNSFVPMDDLFPADSEINWDKAANKIAID